MRKKLCLVLFYIFVFFIFLFLLLLAKCPFLPACFYSFLVTIFEIFVIIKVEKSL